MSDEQNALENRPKPFSAERTKAIVCKVIYFYSLFFVIMKFMAVMQGAMAVANMIVAVPFMVFAWLGFRMEKRKTYSWIYVVVGVLVISLIRYYELDLLRYLENQF